MAMSERPLGNSATAATAATGHDAAMEHLEQRGRHLFDVSVENVDMRIRSRLNHARQSALEAAAAPRARWLRAPLWTSAAGLTTAGALSLALWFGGLPGQHPASLADGASNLEDLEMVASADENSADALEMLQDDIEFYDWAAGKSAPESGNVG
jgi:hypothetical protein